MAEARKKHIVLTSHPHKIYRDSPEIKWGHPDPLQRGPIIGAHALANHQNAIGGHGGSYTVYRALATAAGQLPPEHKPDLHNTNPVVEIGPHPSWGDPKKIVSLDPWGGRVFETYKDYYKKGYDIRPTIAITQAHLNMMEIEEAVKEKRIQVDGKIVKSAKEVVVTKAAIEPVWYLPGIAERYGIEEADLRRALFEETGGMFPELITRFDLKLLLPPIGSTSVYIFGDLEGLHNPKRKLTCRVHDECNGSDVFGSDICTCRPYLTYAIEEAIRTAQEGGTGLIVYFRKEGRALGEVTKFLVYNARKRSEGGDTASKYFYRTECVAGVQDMRFQEFMPDVLHWLGVTKIDNLVSMSNMKYDAIVKSGIQVLKRTTIPDEMIPEDAKVEMEAKKAAGYFSPEGHDDLEKVKGRKIEDK
ncbi:MAG: GTP cyclohydrolase II [Proteobacteria bacterium]|nr:GTP cyclohydrolase II [Pseudomonadota bacterium]